MTELSPPKAEAKSVRGIVEGRPSRAANATIYDIAKLAGVNPSTVSRALSKPGRVSVSTRKLIEDAAAELNYQANPFAKALPTGRTSTIGLIVADVANSNLLRNNPGSRINGCRSWLFGNPRRVG
ncbi:DNA-binding MurR/RpiR family transcriptional regulator [Pseudarthrobacter siccitolerans]|uniref:DNA-binding MurR/RpiR family transcriptional regulator n=1 Tax=Pseudarthrobacter siccitolerans TaxID=861266 RepID=A0ABU0PMB2_9MICC|nr:LacI family DNA-binding transcriptional regulator [Pseudarthrobacter siccitolerans]MDQ0675113.1 DNA-binding MurR/RpiR family transcriptional regulator [Pseudarthrobacter siccitolerans]